MSNEEHAAPPASPDAWLERNLSQLRYFRSLSVYEKLRAIEGMADVVRRLNEIRAQNGFHSPAAQPPGSE